MPRLFSLVLLLSLVLQTIASRSFLKPNALQRRHGGRQLKARQQWASSSVVERGETFAPKLIILSLFDSEAGVWYDNMPDLLSHNISVPGLCPLFPEVHCTPQGQVCQLTCCEGEINAASSLSALIYSRMFTLTHTYFLIAGVAGINPHIATTGSVTFSKYAVQFDLQYEFDSRQIPSNDSYGYFPQYSFFPDSPAGTNYPGGIYGTEVFALNNNLKEKAIYLASQAKLNDTTGAAAYRKKYPYKPANQPPKVLACDTGTSNVFWSGSILGDAFSAYTKLLTNGSGTYCATQQEDNAICEVLLRGDLAGVVDFSRLMIMRTASDFDRAPPSEDEVYHLLYADQEGFLPSIENIYIAGSEIVKDILKNWDGTWKGGIAPGGYIGDAFNSLKGKYPPDIGTEAIYIN